MKPKKSLKATQDYLKCLQGVLYYLEDPSKDYLSPLEYIILQEWKRVNKQIKRNLVNKIQEN